MPANGPVEIVFYVHGVMGSKEGRRHTEEYTALHEGIASADVDSAWPAEFGGAEWGWNFDDGDLRSHKALTASQNVLGDQVLELLNDQRDFTINPARLLINKLRDLVFFGFGDMFYYVSADGKLAVRHEIAGQLLDHINERRPNAEQPVSLTLVGHSAGSVVAFDFLYYLFSKRKRRFLRTEDDETARRMASLRDLATSGKLRLRRLVTFGSPISLVAFRSDALVEILARGDKLKPEDYGLTSTLESQSDLDGARWLNLWDKDDPIAWPTAPLMSSPLAEDRYVDVSDSVSSAHDAYWTAERVHELIASEW